MNKTKLIVVLGTCMIAGGIFAAPHGHHVGVHRPPPVVHHHGGVRHHGAHWGRGGRNFWPGFVGGVVGGVIANTICDTVVTTPVVTAPTVITQPVVVQTAPTVVTQPVVAGTTRVWVEGCYVEQVQANGTVLRVWQPGHYEVR